MPKYRYVVCVFYKQNVLDEIFQKLKIRSDQCSGSENIKNLPYRYPDPVSQLENQEFYIRILGSKSKIMEPDADPTFELQINKEKSSKLVNIS